MRLNILQIAPVNVVSLVPSYCDVCSSTQYGIHVVFKPPLQCNRDTGMRGPILLIVMSYGVRST
jgi:hypothetical protein